MYYFRLPTENGQWRESKLNGDEVRKLQSITIVERLKAVAKVKAVAKELKAEPTEQEILFAAEGVAPRYESLAADFIRKNWQIEAEKRKAGTSV